MSEAPIGRYFVPATRDPARLAFELRGQQVRYLTVTQKRKDSIASIERVKGPDRAASIVLAATIEGLE